MSGKEIDKIFAEKLKNHRVKPSSNAWKRLDKELGKDDRKPGAWWKWAAPLLFITLMAGAYHFWPSQQDNASTQLPEKITTELKKEVEKPVEAIKEIQNDINTKQKTTDAITIKKPEKTKSYITKGTQKTVQHKKASQAIVNTTKKASTDQSINTIKQDNTHTLPSPDKQEILDDTDLQVTKDVKKLDKKDDTATKEIEPKVLKSKPSPVLIPKKEVKERKKKKRVKVEITVPSRNKRLKKLGQQQTQGMAINFKKVLHRVFDN